MTVIADKVRSYRGHQTFNPTHRSHSYNPPRRPPTGPPMKAHSDELKTFATVIDCGSITAAAEQLGLTPSAVSRALSKLEEKLGTTLLNRTTRRMKLTEEGEFFLEHARHILEQMDALEERLALLELGVSRD